MHRTVFLFAIFTQLFAVTAVAQDGPATRYLRGKHDDVLTILRRPASEGRTRDITTLLDGLLDYDELSRRALQTHWGELSAAEQREFVDLLRQLVERQYQSNLARILEADIRYLGEDTSSDGTIVHTEVRSRTERRAEPVRIDYLARNEGGVWRVIDVTTDGVSLVANYRRQFHRIISEHGSADLLRRMRERLAAPAE
jgi:phospholipid transport system substrate-binding protein